MTLNKTCQALLAVGVLVASPWASARFAVEPHWAGAQLGLANVNAKGGDLDVGEAFTLEVGRWFTNNFGVEMGVSALRDAKEEGSDNRGTYELNLESEETYVGPRISTNHFDTFRVFGSGGVLYSRVNIEVKEEFFNLKPGGSASDRDEGIGYYLSGGISFALPGRVDLNAVLRYRQRLDVLETYAGDVDLSDTSLNIGAAFRF